MLRGDLPKDAPFNTDYILLKNTTVPGDKVPTFVDTARDAQIARLGFGWGTVFADMNMDGHLDILASQNYAKMPLNFLMKQYCGKLLQNDGEGHFTPVGITANALSKGFGITPLIADYNGDGYPDIVWVNIDGPAKAHINDASGPKGVIIPFPDTTRSLNARVEYETDAGIVSRQVIAGQGLGSDQTRTMFMPPQDGITLIYYLDGRGERRKF
ncbi:MAG TPA: VCBS repeat-containing protein [Hellea balneolensis]|uniref:VCBS repeat-containing protein n=1 Tax=Hellea balneolensis TaxID=287478 RepID=A0A7C3C677_9PROT|nr:VCBS repeat-containing protein [Hellea balneolensis]